MCGCGWMERIPASLILLFVSSSSLSITYIINEKTCVLLHLWVQILPMQLVLLCGPRCIRMNVTCEWMKVTRHSVGRANCAVWKGRNYVLCWKWLKQVCGCWSGREHPCVRPTGPVIMNKPVHMRQINTNQDKSGPVKQQYGVSLSVSSNSALHYYFLLPL